VYRSREIIGENVVCRLPGPPPPGDTVAWRAGALALAMGPMPQLDDTCGAMGEGLNWLLPACCCFSPAQGAATNPAASTSLPPVIALAS